MRFDLKKYFLGDVCTKIFSGGTPSTHFSEYWNGDLKWLSSGETSQRFIYDTERKITQKAAEETSTKLAKKGDTVVAAAGQGYTRGQASFLMTDTFVNQSLIVCRADERFVLPLYLFYNLSNRYEEFRLLSDGTSTRGGLSGWILKRMQIALPDLITQRKIVTLLYAIDEKIATNRAINDNLEQQAQALFKSWFVDFEPFDGELPSSWTNEKLGNVCNCVLGGTPSRAKPEYWNGTIPWINSGEVNNFRIIKPSETITELGLTKSATKLLPLKTTVIAITGATLGQVSLLEIDACANQSVVGIIPNDDYPYEYIYPLIKQSINELTSHQTGGAQQHINKQNVESLDILVPTAADLDKYCNTVHNLYEMIATNCFENEYLTSLRDTLLPKLMSGELDVSNIEL